MACQNEPLAISCGLVLTMMERKFPTLSLLSVGFDNPTKASNFPQQYPLIIFYVIAKKEDLKQPHSLYRNKTLV